MWFSEHPSQRCQRAQRPSPSLPHPAVSHPCFPRTPGRINEVKTHQQLGPGDFSPYPSSRPPTHPPPLSFHHTIPGRQEAPHGPGPTPTSYVLPFPPLFPPFCPSPPPDLALGPWGTGAKQSASPTPSFQPQEIRDSQGGRAHSDKDTNLQPRDLETTFGLIT